MDKKEMQDQELTQVAGGGVQPTVRCHSCGKACDTRTDYPQGSYLRTEKNGWCTYTNYHKCPHCGYEWTI